MHDERKVDAARECIGFQRSIPSSEKLYPVTLYHVSVNRNSVCRYGLLTPNELSEKGINVQGIGGANDEFISFTYEDTVARDYAADILTLSRIANNIVTPKTVESYLDKHDASPGLGEKPSAVLNGLFSGEERKGYGSSKYDYENVVQDLKRGVVLDKKTIYEHVKDMSNAECEEFLEKNNVKLNLKLLCEDRGLLKVTIFPNPVEGDWRRVSAGERQEIMFELVRNHYFYVRSRLGGRRNPLFFGVHIDNYRKIKPSDVGIFKVLAYLPRSLDEYFHLNEFVSYGEFSEKYPKGFGTTKKWARWERKPSWRPDEIQITRAEREVRIHPKYTTMLEEIPI